MPYNAKLRPGSAKGGYKDLKARHSEAQKMQKKFILNLDSNNKENVQSQMQEPNLRLLLKDLNLVMKKKKDEKQVYLVSATPQVMRGGFNTYRPSKGNNPSQKICVDLRPERKECLLKRKVNY